MNQSEFKRVKEIAKWHVGGTPSTNSPIAYNGDDSWATIADMKGREIVETKNTINGSFLDKKKTKKGSLLFSFKLSIGKVAFAGKDIYTNEAICSFTKNSKIDLNYFYYAAPVYISRNKKVNIYGADLLNQDLIRNAIVYSPNKQKQKKIANFLGKSVIKIDYVLNMYTKKIELLKEHKQSLIYEATNGLCDDEIMAKKDNYENKKSRVWCLRRLKDIACIKKGRAVATFDFEDDNKMPLIDTNFLRDRMENIVYADNGVKVDNEDVLILWDGANSGELFYNKEKGFLGSTFGVLKLKNKRNIKKYLYYCLKSMEFDIRSKTVGMGIPHVNANKLKQMVVSIPEKEHQIEIVKFLDNHIKNNDHKIDILKRKSKLIEELRESIIYEAVTGQIDVDTDGDKYLKMIDAL